MELKLERCTIRSWRTQDAESLQRYANNRRVWLGLRDLFPYPYTIADAHAFLGRTVVARAETFACIEITGAAVGGIGVTIGSDVHRRTAELGYWLAEEFWGRGVMSEAVPAFVNYCFATFPLDRIYAQPYANNAASARVLEKAAFVLEGRLRKNVIKDGDVLDSLLYARTR